MASNTSRKRRCFIDGNTEISCFPTLRRSPPCESISAVWIFKTFGGILCLIAWRLMAINRGSMDNNDLNCHRNGKNMSVSGMFTSRYALGWLAFALFALAAIFILNSSVSKYDGQIIFDQNTILTLSISLVSVYLVAGLISYFAYKLFEITVSKDNEGNATVVINGKTGKSEMLQIKCFESFACRSFEHRINFFYAYIERPMSLFLVITTKAGHQIKLQGEFTRFTKINHVYYDLPFYRAEYTNENGHKKIEEMVELLKSSNAVNIGRESNDGLEE